MADHDWILTFFLSFRSETLVCVPWNWPSRRVPATNLYMEESRRYFQSCCQRVLRQRDNLFSATNLTHYLALKGLDLQLLKEDLSSIGLLDLESINSHVLASIDIIIQLLHKLLSNTLDNNDSAIYLDKGYSTALLSGNVEGFNMETIKKRISHHATGLFGEHRGKKSCHLMVTVGREGASTEMLIPNLLKAGADVIRINCAHDNLTIWSEIIRIVKYNCQMLEKPCRILMDLAGTKLRTQSLRTYLNIVKISPKKDSEGNVIFSALVWLCCDGCDPPAHLYPNAIICIKKSFFNKLKTGETLDFVDARGRKRFLRVLKKSPSLANYGCMAECLQTTYIKVGTELLVKKKRRKISGQVLKIPAVKLFIRLKVGDLLTIFKSSFMSTNEFGITALASKVITCSDHLHDLVEVGEPIAFDDGKIQGKIKEKCLSSISVLITHASPKGSKLRAGKSINVPKSKIQFKGLSQKDLIDLDFVGANADMVGFSFIRDVAELVFLQHELEKRNLQNLGIILKVETKDGLQRLPSLLFQAMQSSNPVGVMIARGDLMVECGWDKLGDIQEEILSICSAAHIPVIWATQVLESLIKFGFPTRAEITDVAAAMR
ncbi:Plastidial pyruvate kinase 4, chloroplastic [Apostasia shenzhenica]|uniref:pyruvate kinase n=1 Tax=Apostasia shenzhenica TaxID=1088818 RepID=A0A2I0AJQ1_9ASPA|nr:Plastidial pyruvate kinase 4, chloroplastic [Apostasia shenzhenica]